MTAAMDKIWDDRSPLELENKRLRDELNKLQIAIVDMSRRKTEIENKDAIQAGELEKAVARAEYWKLTAHSEMSMNNAASRGY